MADFQSYFPLFLMCLISSIFMWMLFKSVWGKSHLPPSPFALPVIGHLHLLSPTPHRAFHKLSHRYGPIFRVLIGNVPCVVASSAETASQFLKTNENSYLDRPGNSALKYLTYGSKDFAFVAYGPYWKFMKKIVTSRLFNGTTLDSLQSVRQDEINRFMMSLYQNAKDGKPVDVGAEIGKTTNNLISRMIMNKRCSGKESEAKNMRKLFANINEIAGNFNLSDNIRLFKNVDLQGRRKKLESIHRRYDDLIEAIIREHEESRKQQEIMGSQGKDLLSILLDVAKDESTEIDLTKENIKALILNLFTAGTDPTALTIEWALAELINHPEIMKKATKEIDSNIGKNRLIEESDICDLPYLQSVVKETLRLHAPAPLIPRKSTTDCIVAGYHIPAKTNIFVNIWAIGRDPYHWENPLEFRPERFLDNLLDVRGQHFHMLPFGTGRRICPGTSLALSMIQITLGAMIQCFEWKAGKDGNLTSVDMTEGTGLTLSRAYPLICFPVARLDPIPSLK
ncbi:cytochrome P450 93A3-like [Bidens hawaiensis]|uniref:cytochrome P450 93A3-like n=1 Tax=Bidens hawaiensis TaxID=980011 RepID=UPI0040494EB0